MWELKELYLINLNQLESMMTDLTSAIKGLKFLKVLSIR